MLISVLIPTTSADRLTSGPPELPGLILASVWMYWRTRPPDICTWRADLAQAADDAGRDGLIEAQRAADGEHPLTHVELLRIAQPRRHQIRRRLLQPDHGDVGLGVRPDRLRGELAPVVEA